ncbi:hypothetical protein V6N11_037801 [Hibiscus sabdariffa]|uniref:RNase H type-1 domain-containing protein n=1 Tax=Hibiscus sabdariffa TaxID=183260 RepID=A0ABR2NAS1_9ROSI
MVDINEDCDGGILLWSCLESAFATVPPPCGEAGADRLVWRLDAKQCFTTCSAYDYLSHEEENADPTIWCSFMLCLDVTDMDDTLTRGNHLVEECSHAILAATRTTFRQVEQPRWAAPSQGFVKLNVDATISPVTHKAGIGGAFRDANGCWISGFTIFIGRCDVLIAEFWAIHGSLRLAWDFGFPCLELESDCLEATRIITSASDTLSHSSLVSSIKEMLAHEWRVVLKHVYRENNKVVDRLAGRGRELGSELMYFPSPPDDVRVVVEEELVEAGSVIGELTGIG